MRKIGLLFLGVLCALGLTACNNNETADSTTKPTETPSVTEPVEPTVPEQAKIVELVITTKPTKLKYFVGEHFDPTGMVVTAKFSDKTEKVITDYDCMKDLPINEGQKLIVISAGDAEAYLEIEVIKDEIIEVSIKTNPTKTSYKNYESFDPAGLVLTAKYSSGKTEDISDGFKWNKDQLLDLPEQMKVTYHGMEVNVPITVEKVNFYGIPNAKERTYIDAKAVADQLKITTPAAEIRQDTIFGDVRLVNSNPGRGMAFEKVGQDYYRNFRGQKFEGMLKFGGTSGYDNRWIEVNPTEDGFLYFSALTRSSDAQFIMYENFTEMSQESDIVRTLKIEKDVERVYSIPLYKGERLCITTNANAFIYGMMVEYKPEYHDVKELILDTTNANLAFAAGGQFNAGNLKVSAKLDNDKVVELRDYDYEIAPVDLSQPGAATVLVKYQGLEKSYDVNVEALTGIKITKNPDKVKYFAGETVDLTGIEVMAFTASGLEYVLTEGFEASNTGKLTEGETLKLVYGKLECELPVVVEANPIDSIEIKTAPTKTSYKTDELFDPTGLVIQANLSNGSKLEITDLSLLTFDKTKLSDDDTKVIVKYETFTAEIMVTVIPTDYYVEDNTTYYDPVKIWGELADERANVKQDVKVGDIQFYSMGKAFQYENKSVQYEFEGLMYQGVFKAGGTTDFAGRYMKMTPSKNAIFRAMANLGSKDPNRKIFLVETAAKPDAANPESYVSFVEIEGGGAQKLVEFNLEAGKTYYLYFEGQTYIKGMYLSYGRVKSEITSLELDTAAVKKEFTINEAFSTEGLVVKANCLDGNKYELNDFEVVAPDMTSAGTKVVTIKFGKVSVATYEIVVK